MTDIRTEDSPGSNRVEMDAVSLLISDHEKVSDLFDDYEQASSNEEKKEIVLQICEELSVHAQLEEEIFYPAFKAAQDDETLVEESLVEHNTMKDLIEQIEGVEPDGESFDAKVKLLSRHVKHHVKEEQSEMFAEAKTDAMDLDELGALIAERKADLLADRE